MDVRVIAALIAAVTSLFVALITHRLQTWAADRQRRGQINSQYLNPLRLYAEETYYRLFELLFEPGFAPRLLALREERDISTKDDDWFTGEGCYLSSSCYFTACLFASVVNVRADIPYLRLGRNADTELLDLTLRVSKAFLRTAGVFYAIQHSIGAEMYRDGRLISYREFCRVLQDSTKSTWFHRLIRLYLDLGRGVPAAWERGKAALEAIWNLSRFVDKSVRGGHSIETRLRAEHKLTLLPGWAKVLRFLSGNRLPETPNPALNRTPTANSAIGAG